MSEYDLQQRCPRLALAADICVALLPFVIIVCVGLGLGGAVVLGLVKFGQLLFQGN